VMTDKEYVNQLSAISQTLKMLDPLDQDDVVIRDKLLEDIHNMNTDWNKDRHWRHWHYVVKLILLFIVLLLVVLKIIC